MRRGLLSANALDAPEEGSQIALKIATTHAELVARTARTGP